MSRLWWATIAGLVLGAVFFGMLQRGCEAEGRPGDGSSSSVEQRQSGDARASARPGRRAVERPQLLSPQILNRSQQREGRISLSQGATGAISPARPRVPDDQRQVRRRSEQSRSAISDFDPRRFSREAIEQGRAERERRRVENMERQRRFLEEQRRRAEAAEGRRSGSRVDLDRGERGDRVALSTMQAARSREGNAMRGDLATSRFQSSIGGASQSGGTGGDGAGANGGGTASTGGGLGGSGGAAQGDGPVALGSIGTPGGNGIGGAGAGGGGTGGAGGGNAGGDVTDGAGGGDTPPADGDPDGGDGVDGGGAGNGGGDGGGIDTGEPVLDPEPPQPPQPVLARWDPIETPDCPDASGVRTADLFLGFDDPALALVVSSQPPLALSVDGGRFFQDTSGLGSNVPPSEAIQNAFPCVRADSFVALGDASIAFVPGGEPNPLDWGSALEATWFSQAGAAAAPDPIRFGDDRFYVRVARVSVAGTGDISVSGALTVNFVNLDEGTSGIAVVDVPNCASCWEGVDSPTVEPELESFELTSRRVTGGAAASGLIALTRPAPPGGTTISITSDRPAVATAPARVTIPAGETSAVFEIATSPVSEPRRAALFVSLGETTLRRDLEVTPVGVGRLTLDPPSVLGGGTVTMTIGLTAAAGPDGARAMLLANPAGIIEIPPSVRIEPGGIEAMIEVQTQPVAQETTVQLVAFIGGVGVFADLEVRPLIGDLNGDGGVGAADLAMLLGFWGPCPADGACPADLDGDGEVGSQDLGELLGRWGDTVSGDDPGGDDPDGSPGGVVARWIEVDTSACEELPSFRSADLFLGFENAPAAPIVSSDLVRGIEIVGGSFYQSPFGGNGPPREGVETTLPCLPLDSHLTIGGAPPLFIPGRTPPADDWGATLLAEWTAIPSPTIEVVVDPGTFGDDREYLRIGRFTAEDTAVIAGQLGLVFVNPTSGLLEERVVDVPDWRLAVERLDLNLDGVIDSQDVEALTGMIERGESGGDLTGDDMVDGADLLLLLEVVSRGESVNSQ